MGGRSRSGPTTETVARAMAAGRSRVGPRRPHLVWALVGVMAAAGLGLGSLLLSSSGGGAGPLTGALHVQLPWWLLAVAFYLAGSRAVHLQFQREAHSFTLSEIPLVVGLFLAAPGEVILASVLGSGAALIIHRRPSPVKLAFNLSLYLLGSAVAVSLFRLTAGVASPLAPSTWLAALLAVAVSTVIGLAAVNAAIWLVQGRSDRRRLALAVRFGLAVALTNSCLALIAVTLAQAAPSAPWLLIVPLVLVGIAWLSYRAHIGEREQRDSLQLLYGTTRILHGGTELEAAIVALLRDARRTFRAEFAELTLFTAEGHREGLRTTLGPDDRTEVMAAVRLAPGTDDLRLRAVRDRASFLAPVLSGQEARSDGIGGAPVRDAMVAPLVGERSLIGTFVMANRQGALGTFRPAELQLFETLANHAGVALENGRLGRSLKDLSELKDQLRHQALHDSLTGLGNRDLFTERLAAALDRHGHEGPSPAVVFIDLDDFKAVNDSLGHAGGDQLLRASASAISHGLRPSDLAVRIAGDEFAVLVEDGRDMGSVIRIAERIIEAIARPVEIDGRWITASASVGIAGTRGRAQSAAELMRDADVAMYAAKSRGKSRFAVFDPSMTAELSERQQLRDELSGAISRSELSLRYQPITDLRTGQMLGLEALLRWQHPTRGELAPAAFLPLAEESGLIVPIGRWVLHEACRQAQAWRADRDRPLTVSVNVSIGQLLQPDFVDDVAGILSGAGLPPDALILEFSEAQVMIEDATIASRLRELKRSGVSLAIDGFGNGFSSLRYLGRFPVDIIKIARPLVATMGRTPQDARIAEAIVALGHSLRLQVVAEGIEDPSQLERVRSMDCDRAQGFFLARPLDAAGIGRLLGVGGVGARGGAARVASVAA